MWNGVSLEYAREDVIAMALKRLWILLENATIRCRG